MTKRKKFTEFIKENKRPLAVLALFFAAWLFVVVITYDNWYFYVPWHKARAVKAAEIYLSQTYGKTFDIKEENLSTSSPFYRFSDNTYSMGTVELEICDENGLEANICVNRNYQIRADDYMCVYADDMMNKHFDELISGAGLELIDNIEFESDRFTYITPFTAVNENLKGLAGKDKVDKAFFEKYSKTHFWVYIKVNKQIENTASQVYEVMKTVCNSGVEPQNCGFSLVYINRNHPVDITYNDFNDENYVMMKIKECLRYLS